MYNISQVLTILENKPFTISLLQTLWEKEKMQVTRFDTEFFYLNNAFMILIHILQMQKKKAYY